MELLPNQDRTLPLVLIVDDNPAICNVIAWSLRLNGFRPIEAANGLEAVKWMEQAANEQSYPSTILLDLTMPGMDGHAFLGWLQSTWVGRYPMPAIILMTASSFNEKAHALFPPIKQIVTKPFHTHDLLEIVRKWST